MCLYGVPIVYMLLTEVRAFSKIKISEEEEGR